MEICNASYYFHPCFLFTYIFVFDKCLGISGDLDSLTTESGNTVPTAEWALVRNSDGKDVYARRKHKSNIHEAFVTTEILAPPPGM